ncbi:NmrA family NAD(P)-binding protein [Nocardia terpenica]|uniref:SDR family oxidoreductase n=1 Tax=Nocardia terpenica TaxID=455432 RepID=UPI0018950FE9|nr:NmrA family NAD(P)-binding protein [Nocardia terpenica]MBF6065372.1 NmrA family NAD(P)-binding protein [Nocardia terpenica]MBF6108944.1 NmrA family NAD(P)-binding protein [Nocardia terpenica]MBF6121787.1 NmrA family NAD(P)-binding protein [Nocardia terpenica]
MTVLVTGSTGTVGSEVVGQLAAQGVPVRALTRSPEKASFPAGVTPVAGELTDPDAMRAALAGVSGVFLLSAVAPDELTGTVNTLTLAREAGVRNIVYLSVIHADRFTDPPHFAAKAAAERMIADFDLPATILRPGYYMQNDIVGTHRRALNEGVYAPPVGNRAVLATDIRDLAEVAVVSLLRREQAGEALPPETIDVVAPEVLTGTAIADLWSAVLDRPIAYAGDDLEAYGQQMREVMPGWMIFDMLRMLRRFQTDGMHAAPGTDERLRELLGRPMRSYHDFARDAAAAWTN